jgi:K(+)-stimulated pyrophosphate-energized sodium pump
VVFCFALALPFFNPYFFIGYLIGIAFFGLFQAIFMANAGGAWDNAKKIVEVDLRQKGTELHAATVVGDTVGDPFKDTSSVAMNPVIKFTTLFGLLAVEIAVTMKDQTVKTGIGVFFFVVALVFVYRSFYAMRIPEETEKSRSTETTRESDLSRKSVQKGHGQCPHCGATLDVAAIRSMFSASATIVGTFKCGNCGKSIQANDVL